MASFLLEALEDTRAPLALPKPYLRYKCFHRTMSCSRRSSELSILPEPSAVGDL